MKMHHEKDPKAEILEKLNGAHFNYHPIGADILVATYMLPEKTSGGIILSDYGTKNENEYQGRVGLVLGLGPLVNSKEIDEFFGGRLPEIGDWIVFRGGDTYTFKLGGKDKWPCRTVEAKLVRGFITDPDLIW